MINGGQNSLKQSKSSKTKDIATLLEEMETANQKMTECSSKGDISGSLKTNGTIQTKEWLRKLSIRPKARSRDESITVKTVENGENFKITGGENTPLYTRYEA